MVIVKEVQESPPLKTREIKDNIFNQALCRFQALLKAAGESNVKEPTAATLATADAKGYPSARMVLLKGADEKGFVFFSNTKSRKGEQLATNPNAALCFYWQPLFQQVLVEGPVEFVSNQESENYWMTRPRKSQIGAWASLQSQFLRSQRHLIARAAKYGVQFLGRKVPRPPHWCGYRVIPNRIEFWENRPQTFPNRDVFIKTGAGWSIDRLFP